MQGTRLACDLCHNPIRDRDARPYSIARNNVSVDFATRRYFGNWTHIASATTVNFAWSLETRNRAFWFHASSLLPDLNYRNAVIIAIPFSFHYHSLERLFFFARCDSLLLHVAYPKPPVQGAFFCATFGELS